jgi:SMI1 / KNR4 family (SUKH-1)
MSTTRLIAPITEGWNRGERDWSYVKDPSADIARWERDIGFQLPDAYRRFMLTFNGGNVYPRLFRHNVPQDRYWSTEPVTQIDPLYSWADVEEHTRGGVYGRGNPPDMLFIGTDPGGLEVLLSLRVEDRGHIFCWPHSTNIWGMDGNDQIWPQATSFEAFLHSLFDLPDESDYKAWRLPIYDKLARPLVF